MIIDSCIGRQGVYQECHRDTSEVTPMTDPNFSYLCYYVLEKNPYVSPTGSHISEYDNLFREINPGAEILRMHIESGIHTESNDKLAFVVEKYKETHP